MEREEGTAELKKFLGGGVKKNTRFFEETGFTTNTDKKFGGGAYALLNPTPDSTGPRREGEAKLLELELYYLQSID